MSPMRVSKLSLPLLGSLSVLLAGCSANFGTTDTGPVKASVTIQGHAYGGQQPLSNSHVYLYEVGTGGYGGASSSLLNSSTGLQDSNGNWYVLTDKNGNFSVTGDYTCPGGATGEVYVYASGGDPQLTGIGVPSGNNPYIGLMAVLGTCANITPGYYVTVNEASTVAAAYALAGFATDATHIGSSGTALAKQGVVNAGTLALKLVDQGTGTANATFPNNSTATVPVNTINALADILSYCVNSTGSGNCTNLFSKTLSASGAQPVDTATAAIYIAQNPAANGNVGALISLIPATAAPFATTLSSANDFTLGVVYSGGGLRLPISVAIDGSGDAWFGNLGFGGPLVGISPSGSYLTGSSGFTDANLDFEYPQIAVDTNGNIWNSNFNNDTVVKISPSGTFTYFGTLNTATSYLDYPSGTAIDGSGDLWVANYAGENVAEILPNGSFGVSSAMGAGGALDPIGVYIDGSGNIWTVSNFSNTVSEFSSAGVALSGANGFNGHGIANPYGSAIDSKGDFWTASYLSGQAVIEISHGGAFLSGSAGYSIGAQSGPLAIAIDGTGNAWVTAYNTGYVAELSPAGNLLSGSSGYTASGALTTGSHPFGVAVDGSGNVWVANNTGYNVLEMVGAAAPVITPICAGLPATPTADGSSNLGTRP